MLVELLRAPEHQVALRDVYLIGGTPIGNWEHIADLHSPKLRSEDPTKQTKCLAVIDGAVKR